jgi:hypothetical protein
MWLELSQASAAMMPLLALEYGDPMLDEAALGIDGPDSDDELVNGGCSKDCEGDSAGDACCLVLAGGLVRKDEAS